MRKDAALKSFGVLFLFVLLSFLYLYPGSLYLLQGRDDIFLSDGTDSLTQAHQYGLILQEFKAHPSHLLYGAVYTPSMNSPEGYAVWNTWPERFFVVLMSPFVQLEQISTAWSLFLLVMTGLSFVAMGRFLKWPWAITLALAISWAFSAYTRARAKVHTGFLGLYFLPLIVLALWMLHKGKGRRSIAGSSILILIAATTAQYYVLMAAFLAPIFIGIYFYIEHGSRTKSQSLIRLVGAGIPACLFCIYILAAPLPGDLREKTKGFPITGQTTEAFHPFLETFAARPFDYLTGDTGIDITDMNPLRETLNLYNFESNPIGNNHERTNGIRWSLLFLFVVLLCFYVKTANSDSSKRSLRIGLGFTVLGLLAFLLSLPPSYFAGYSPSVLLSKILPQFRVSSRAGIFVHFAVLMAVGFWITEYGKSLKNKRWLWILPAIALIDLPPIYNPMPATQIQPRISRVQGLSYDQCGYGMFFPSVSASVLMLDFYSELNRMRGSGCGILNSADANLREQKLFQRFPPSAELLDAVQKNNPNLEQSFQTFVNCMNLRFVVFASVIPDVWKSRNCEAIGGTLDPQGLCFRENANNLKPASPDLCF